MVKLSKVLMGLLIEIEDAGEIKKGIIRLTDGYTMLLEIVEGKGWNSSNMWHSTTIPHHSSTKQYWNYSKSKDFKILDTPENREILLKEAEKCIGYKIDNQHITDALRISETISDVKYDGSDIIGSTNDGTWTLFSFKKQKWCNIIDSNESVVDDFAYQWIRANTQPNVLYQLKKEIIFSGINCNSICFSNCYAYFDNSSGDSDFRFNSNSNTNECWTLLKDNIIIEAESANTCKVQLIPGKWYTCDDWKKEDNVPEKCCVRYVRHDDEKIYYDRCINDGELEITDDYWYSKIDDLVEVHEPQESIDEDAKPVYDFSKVLVKKGQYFVLEHSSSTNNGGNDWERSIPVNHIYKASKDCFINDLGIEKDINGSTTNGWSISILSFNSNYSHLKLRHADYLEIYAYELNKGPLPTTSEKNLRDLIRDKIYEIYRPGMTILPVTTIYGEMKEGTHKITDYQKSAIWIDGDSVYTHCQLGFFLRYDGSNKVTLAKIVEDVEEIEFFEKISDAEQLEEDDWVIGWHHQEPGAEHLYSKPWQVGKVVISCDIYFAYPKYGTTTWNTEVKHLQKLTKDEVLKWAAKEYPEGSKYIDADNNPYENSQVCDRYPEFVDSDGIDVGMGYIYRRGKWAEKVVTVKETFEIGKWYESNRTKNLFIKPIEVTDDDKVTSEVIWTHGAYEKESTSTDKVEDWHLVEDLSVIQKFLPDGHVDKVVKKPYWKKVRCTKSVSPWYTVGEIYNVNEDGYVIDNYNDTLTRLCMTETFAGLKDTGRSDFEEYIEEESKHPFTTLKVGDTLSDKVIIEWTKRGHNRISLDDDRNWTNYVSQVQGNREIVKLDYIKGKYAFQVSNTTSYVWYNAEGFEEFYLEYLRTNFLIERHKLSESLERLQKIALTTSEYYQKPKFYDPHLDTNNLSMPSFDDK